MNYKGKPHKANNIFWRKKLYFIECSNIRPFKKFSKKLLKSLFDEDIGKTKKDFICKDKLISIIFLSITL